MSVPRVAVITEIPTPYRQPVFDLLKLSKEIDVHFFFLNESQKDRYWKLSVKDHHSTTVLKGWQICVEGYHTIHLNFGVSNALIKPGFDLFVIGGYAQPALWRVLWHCWKTHTPYMMITESHLGKRRSGLVRALKSHFVRKVYSRSCANLVMGAQAKEYVSQYGASPSNIFMFPNTIDGPSYSKQVDSERQNMVVLKQEWGVSEGKVILFVGALHRRKGVDLLIESFASLRQNLRDVSLVVVGRGQLEYELKERVRKLNLEKAVVFAGFVQPEDLPKVYACADLFVLPSLEEPFGAVVCEAMAAGLPIIVSDAVGAAKDFVKPNENGMIVPQGSLSSLTSALLELLKDQTKMRGMGQRSKEIMKEWTHLRLAKSLVDSASISLRSNKAGYGQGHRPN